MNIPMDALAAHKVADWWARLNSEEQVEFLALLISTMEHHCVNNGGSSTMQLFSMSKEMARQVVAHAVLITGYLQQETLYETNPLPMIRIKPDRAGYWLFLAEREFYFSKEGLAELRDKIHEHVGADDFQFPPDGVSGQLNEDQI